MVDALGSILLIMRTLGPWMPLIEIVGYLLLSVATLRIAWSTPMGVVAITLPLCCLITNAAYFSHDFGTKVLFEVFQVILLLQTARLAFAAYPHWPALTVVGLAIADLAWCATQPLLRGPDRSFWFGTVTNGIFIITCFCVIFPRLQRAYRDSVARRDPRWLVRGGASAGDAHMEKDA